MFLIVKASGAKSLIRTPSSQTCSATRRALEEQGQPYCFPFCQPGERAQTWKKLVVHLLNQHLTVGVLGGGVFEVGEEDLGDLENIIWDLESPGAPPSREGFLLCCCRLVKP